MMASSLGRAGLEVDACRHGGGVRVLGVGRWAPRSPGTQGLCILLWGRDLFPDGPLASLLALPGGA